jgi:hypothetical protein
MNPIKNQKFGGLGHRHLRTYELSAIAAEHCTFENCVFGFNRKPFSEKRDTIEDSVFRNCKISKCLMGSAIIRNIRVTDLSGDTLICWGTFFDQVILDGKISPLMIHGIPGGMSNNSSRQEYRAIAEQFYTGVKFALDISNAQFSDFSIRTGAIPLSLVRRDVKSQFIVLRSQQSISDDLIDALAISRYSKTFMKIMKEEGVNESLLVAPKLDLALYDQILLDAEVLKIAGCLAVDSI